MGASRNDYIAPIIAKLTTNGAISLYLAAKNNLLNQQVGRLCTGSGKYTTLAAIGVENHLKKHGLIECHPNDDPVRRWTSLGKEVAQYLLAHWDEHIGKFRDGKPPRLIKRVSPGNYKIRGPSGADAGFIQKMKPRGWLLCLYAMPKQSFETFRDAQTEALELAESY